MPKRVCLLAFGLLLVLFLDMQLHSQQQSRSAISIETRIQDKIRELYGDVPKTQGLHPLLGESQRGSMIGRMIGDIAAGVIVDEVGDELYLDAKPCESLILEFRKPYLKEKVGTIQCGKKTFDSYQIRQIGPQASR